MSFSSPLASAASAAAIVPPSAVMNAGFQLDACVKSNVLTEVPDVTPSGKPTKLGVVVATPAFPGGEMQQCICEAVVAAPSPENTTSTESKCVDESYVTIALPVPGDPVGGFSLAP